MKRWILGVAALSLSVAVSASAKSEPTPTPTPPPAGPIKTSLRLPVDVEQGSNGHRVNSIRPYQAAYKIGPALDTRGWQFEPAWVLLKCPTGVWRGGGCFRISKLFWEPGGMRVGARFLVDGSYFGRNEMTAQCGPVLDLDGLLRVGFLVGGGNKPNDHYFGMTTLGIDLVSWKKMLFKPKPGPGPFDDVTDYPVTLIFRTAGRPPAE